MRRSRGFIARFFSRPATTRSIASSKSRAIHGELVAAGRQQRGLVDEVREVGAGEARPSAPRSPRDRRSGSSFTVRAWMRRIASRPLTSGLSTSTWRSKRPGRSRAGSSTSGPIRRGHDDDALRSRRSRPSRRAAGSASARALRVRPSATACATLPSASSSSMKTMHGALASACWNRSRTRAAPTPTNISTNSDPLRLKNGTSASPATARASSVLPVPGGPTSSTPLGMRPPSVVYFAGFFRNSTISRSSSLGFVDARDVRRS